MDAKSIVRRFPWRLSRHLLGEFIVPLLGSVCAFALLSLLMAVFDRLSDFTGTGIPLWRLILFFAACMPYTLVLVSPVSALLAVCWMNAVLGKNSELTAIRSAGISLLLAATEVWAVAIVMCMLAATLSEIVQPMAGQFIERTEARYIDGKHSNSSAKLSLAYSNPMAQRDWFFTRFSVNAASEGVVVRHTENHGGERTTTVITAEKAEYLPQEKVWHLQNGNVVNFTYEPDGTPTSLPPRYFDSEQFPFNETPQDIRLQSRDVETLPISELLQMRRGNRKAMSKRMRRLLDTMIAYRTCSPLATLIAVLFGFAMTIAKGRKGIVQGLVIAVALYVGYYVISQFFLVLGKNGAVNPWLAGTIPTAVALIASVTLAWRRQ